MLSITPRPTGLQSNFICKVIIQQDNVPTHVADFTDLLEKRKGENNGKGNWIISGNSIERYLGLFLQYFGKEGVELEGCNNTMGVDNYP